MRLTALVPLIGTLLLFNSQVEQLVAWPTFFKRDFGITVSEGIPHHNLYFTYFGLCFLGFGSILFSFFCPREISDQPNVGRYVNEAPSAGASVIAQDEFRTVLGLRFSGIEAFDDPNYDRFEYPAALKGDFHELMAVLYQDAELGENPEVPEVMNGAGYVDYTPLPELSGDMSERIGR